MWKHFKSHFPGANVPHLPEWYSFDTMFYDVPALDDGIPGHGGCTMIQMFGGLDSTLLHGVPKKNESEVSDSILDFIRHCGAMEGLMSDNAKSETSFAIQDILRLYTIKDRQSEPHYQHQNPIERCIQDVKHMVKSIMDHVGCPSVIWLLCTLYVIGLLNILVNSKGVIPLQAVTGYHMDISAYLDFHFLGRSVCGRPQGSRTIGSLVWPLPQTGRFPNLPRPTF